MKNMPEWIKELEKQIRQIGLKAQWRLKQQSKLEKKNLNQAYIREDTGEMDLYGIVKDYSTTSDDQKICVYFKNLEKHLIDHITECEVVLGCVAWLTNEQILKALAQKRGISLIVQKEDFLRPDIASQKNWTRCLRELYNSLPKTLDRRDFNTTVLGDMEGSKNAPLIDPIRCVGNYNAYKQSAFPRSHHKFVLFCKYIENCSCKSCQSYKDVVLNDFASYFQVKKRHKDHIKPYAVWTGSFNFTKTATLSFENAIVLQDPKIVEAFFQEYAQIASLSESLDWSATWISPEWTIQTST